MITRVLLADDHALVRAGIANALKEVSDIEIVGEVGDGPGVFALLKELEPDLLLIDITMPEFEPLSAIRTIRAEYSALKILVVSAYDDDMYVKGLLGAGVNGYHLKDQSLGDLKLAVQRVLAGERWVSSRLLSKLLDPAPESQPETPKLTERQRELLRLLQQGLDNQSIARKIDLSVKTVENHLTRLYRQLDVQSRLEAVNYAMQHAEVLGVLGEDIADKAVPSLAPETGSLAILLVDDNTRYRHQLRRMAGKVQPKAHIYEAENIEEAVTMVQRVKPQLALVDVVLGEENGIHCTRRIKAIAPMTRVVLISAYPDREFHRLGLEAGAVAFLDKKDLDIAALRQVIRDVRD